MNHKFITIDLETILPGLPDARDACVARLAALIGEEGGIGLVHLVHADGKSPSLCLYYDPEVTTLAQVERLARAAGLRISERFGHAILPFRLVGGEDAARGVEAGLSAMDGVLGVSVSLPAQAARVEFDRRVVSLEEIERRLRDCPIRGTIGG